MVERSASLQPPGRELTPGESFSFRIGPFDNTTLIVLDTNDTRLQLEVPEDATRVTYTLESDADLGLFVRFGENPDLQDGRVVSDHSHRNRTGNERIVITPQSDPPLRAGTYFLALGVFTTGSVVEGTLTAEVEREGEPPPPTSGNTLTPGQPVSFQRGPVDKPRLFARNDSFRLEVPEDASRVTFTLESDADVLLAVRYGEDNAVQDGSLVFDHLADDVFAGTEEIVITRQSDPPLRAGTYFVSVVVIATGVVVNCTDA